MKKIHTFSIALKAMLSTAFLAFLFVGAVSAQGTVMTTINPDVAIDDFSDPSETITIAGIPGAAPIESITLALDIEHTFSSDLDIFLTAPDGANIEVCTDNGSLNDWISGVVVTFDDAAANSVLVGFIPGNGGSWQPEEAFSDSYPVDGALWNGDWTLDIADDAGGDVGILHFATLTVNYGVVPTPCVVICPNDIIVNLGPGACDAIVSYAIGSTGACETVVSPLITDFTGPFDVANWTWTNNTGGTPDLSGAPSSIIIPSGMNQGGGQNTFSVVVPQDGLITFDWDFNNVADPGFDGFGYSVNGALTILEENAATASGSASATVAAGDVFAFVGITDDGLFAGAMTTVSNFLFGENVTDYSITGPVSGSILAPGVYPVEACATDLVSGDETCCSFSITVAEYSGPTLTSMACNDNVQISVDENCMAIIGADEILEGGPYMCYNDFIVNIEGFGATNVNNVAITLAAGTYIVTVTNPNNNNSCWGEISVEDKLPPTLECLDVDLVCGESTAPNFNAPVSGSLTATSTPGLTIGPDGGTVTTDNILVNAPAGARITNVRMHLDLTHTFIGDLAIDLISPDGDVVALWANQCGPSNVDPLGFDITFDDAGPLIIFCTEADDGGSLGPVDIQFGNPGLALMDGGAAGGNWTLDITDVFSPDGGLLNAWTLFIDYEVVAAYAPIASDNCDPNPVLTHVDVITGDDCSGLSIARTWTATDAGGNTGTCVQTITVAPVSIDGVGFPANYVGECGGSTDPSVTGWPTVNGIQITDDNPICNIFVGFWDKPLLDCGGGTKIIRTWTILDWCTGDTEEGVQVIKLSDNVGPVISCPANMTVNTDFWYCYANVSVSLGAYDECGGGATITSVVSSAGNVVSFGNNYVINELPIGTHTVTATAVDDCDNESSCQFTVTVEDNVPPVPNCDEHTIVSLTNDGPYGLTLVPASVFDDGSYDNCGPVTFRARRMTSCINFDWTTSGACVDDAPNGIVNSRDRGTILRECVPVACCDVAAGPIMVELEVTDASGNINYCMVEMQVQDKLAPFITCPPNIKVSCDYWFDDAIVLNQFVPAAEAGLGVFGTVLDAYEYNDDESFRQPIIIDDPGDNSSSPIFWGIDGWADDNCNVTIDVRTRITDDCSGDDLPADAPANAVRRIERTFRAMDSQGNTSNCQQIIYVVDYDPFDASDITWPRDIPSSGCNLDDCPEGDLTPENLQAMGLSVACTMPRFNDDNCSLIGMTYNDTRFDFVEGACYKILRAWTIIDWCQYDVDEGTGIWYHTQVIKVLDNNGPTFEDCPAGPVTLCVEDEGVELPANNQVFLGEGVGTSCSVHVSISHIVTETCSDIINYDVKVYPFNGSSYIYLQSPTTVAVENGSATLTASSKTAPLLSIRQSGLPYNSPFCGDYHRVLISAEDGCGNASTCEYLVRLEDCKKPSPVCINGLSSVVMPSSGEVTIWAKDFNASSFDDCTPAANLLYSFSGDTYQPSMNYTCDNVPAFGAELSVQIWVADAGVDHNCNNQISWNERNKDFCTTTIVITDNDGFCTGSGSLVGGDVLTYEDLQAVENTSMNLSSPSSVFPTYVTVEDGHYQFIVPLGDDYTIAADRNDDHMNGVSTLDLVKIQKHLLGVAPLDNPYDMIAADANNSETVSAIDLVELRKLILGIYTELPSNTSWRFVDSQFEFANPAQPWPFEEVIGIANLQDNMMDNDFVAIKVGDVNNTVVANATQVEIRNANSVFNIVTDDRNVVAGETVEVTFSSEDFNTLVGYQFTMNAKGLSFNGVKGAAINMEDQNIGLVDGQITTSWHKVEGVRLDADAAMFTMEFVATANGRLSQMLDINSNITLAEAYDKSEEIMDVALTFRGSEDAEFALYQNEPNPFSGKTVIGFDLPQGGSATLTVFDVTGKVLKVVDGDFAKGFNRVELSGKDLSATGVLYYRLDADEYTATKKMVIIK